MKAFFLKASAVSLLIALLLVGFSMVSAALGLIGPSNPLFALQFQAERSWAGWQTDPVERVGYEFVIAERRLQDLIESSGSSREMASLRALDASINNLAQVITDLSLEEAAGHTARFVVLLQNIHIALDLLDAAPDQAPQLFMTFRSKVESLLAVLIGEPDPDLASASLPEIIEQIQLAPPEATAVAQATVLAGSGGIQFPPGSAGAEHEFFPLNGAHAEVSCQGCHIDDQYAGTPSDCTSCHSADAPVPHYSGDCASCHLPTAWNEATFDHALVASTSCSTCHELDRPVGHFSGSCSSCHITSAWLPATFSHQALDTSDCKACHLDDKPSNHYGGQCSACHNTSSWSQATFNHSGQTQCKDCHSDDKPSNHYGGQCSACHSTTSWGGAAFSHSGQTQCKDCHSDDKPSNHFGGQCSACHSTTSWGGAAFSHSGQTQCKDCHSGDAPSNHFSGQCSDCHSTSSWGGASFSHSGLNKCKDCHSEDAPSNHFSGQCSSCHSTNDWDFDHDSGGNNCLKCHAGDEPDDDDEEDHPSGQQCSDCHNTDDWDD
jgi:hypothetical protein